MSKTVMQIRGGAFFDFLNPDPALIKVEHVARSLARIPRYVGHTDFTVSVAQHSVLCSYEVEPGYELEALCHDAHEAYINDIPGPLKHAVKALLVEWGYASDPVAVLEERARRATATALGLADDARVSVSAAVKEVDVRMLQTERLRAFRPSERCDDHWPSLDTCPPYHTCLVTPWTEPTSRAIFLSRYYMLTGKK
jgi:hypothetical protein